ncbi:hypothetical protein [Fundidesulfovibrio putealis]|uniref:hypothetical protein n=1 Tax=Fundidesulfovibrio putealis TaxID=270496 RepID=UPI000408B1DF|nr:hypothetical protein [Fundidesulfovibrio putealis]
MKISDRHFLRFAGAEPARQMRKEQRLAHDAYSQDVAYERPLNHPERPSNKDRAFLEGLLSSLPDSDNPSKIAAALSSFQPPVPEGQELTVVKDGPDNPTTIAANAAAAALPAGLPPPAMTGLAPQALPEEALASAPASSASGLEPLQNETLPTAAPLSPTVTDLPAEARPRGEELPAASALAPTATDIPTESRPAQEALPTPPPLALTAVDMPVSSRGDSGPVGSSLDLAAELRPAPQAPERSSGLIVSETA